MNHFVFFIVFIIFQQLDMALPFIHQFSSEVMPYESPGAFSTDSHPAVSPDNDLYLFSFSGNNMYQWTNSKTNDLWIFNVTTKLWSVNTYGSKNGNYTDQGQFSNFSFPTARTDATIFLSYNQDSFFVFGGNGFCSDTSAVRNLNDLWEYSFSSQQWKWHFGQSLDDLATLVANYTSIGIFETENRPGARKSAIAWAYSDSIFVYSGDGWSNVTVEQLLSDVWQYNLTSGEWALINGSYDPLMPFWGTKGQFDGHPGSRTKAAYFFDSSSDSLYIIGGEFNNTEATDDVWIRDQNTTLWKYIGGHNVSDYSKNFLDYFDESVSPGAGRNPKIARTTDGFFYLNGKGGVFFYNTTLDQYAGIIDFSGSDVISGVRGQYAAGNKPFTSASSVLGLLPVTREITIYGGNSRPLQFLLNLTSLEFQWYSGSLSEYNKPILPGQGIIAPAPSDQPAAVSSLSGQENSIFYYGGSSAGGILYDHVFEFFPSNTSWNFLYGDIDTPPYVPGNLSDYQSFSPYNAPPGVYGHCMIPYDDGFFIFGGLGKNGSAVLGAFNILFFYSKTMSEWKWVSGNLDIGDPGVTPAPEIGIPKARYGHMCVSNTTGFFMFGGQGNTSDYFDDLWYFDFTTSVWTWLLGNYANNNIFGLYGNPGNPSIYSVAHPGSRSRAGIVYDSFENGFWLVSGYGMAKTLEGDLGDTWFYNPDINKWTFVTGATIHFCSEAVVPYSCRADVAIWNPNNEQLFLYGGSGVYEVNLWVLNKTSLIWSQYPTETYPNYLFPASRDAPWYTFTDSQGFFGSGSFSAGVYSDVWSIEFNGCVNGQYSDNGTCTQCPENSYSIVYDLTSPPTQCTECPPGMVADSGRTLCLPCAATKYRGAGMLVCTDCPASTSSNIPGVGQCLPCPKGQANNQTGQLQCTNCNTGSYSASTGAEYCDSCEMGSYQDVPGSSSCSLCSAGTWSTVGVSECTDCVPGSFAAFPGSISCEPCPRGSYSNFYRGVICAKCQPGFTTTLSGATECVKIQPLDYKSNNIEGISTILTIFLPIGAILGCFLLPKQRRSSYVVNIKAKLGLSVPDAESGDTDTTTVNEGNDSTTLIPAVFSAPLASPSLSDADFAERIRAQMATPEKIDSLWLYSFLPKITTDLHEQLKPFSHDENINSAYSWLASSPFLLNVSEQLTLVDYLGLSNIFVQSFQIIGIIYYLRIPWTKGSDWPKYPSSLFILQFDSFIYPSMFWLAVSFVMIWNLFWLIRWFRVDEYFDTLQEGSYGSLFKPFYKFSSLHKNILPLIGTLFALPIFLNLIGVWNCVYISSPTFNSSASDYYLTRTLPSEPSPSNFDSALKCNSDQVILMRIFSVFSLLTFLPIAIWSQAIWNTKLSKIEFSPKFQVVNFVSKLGIISVANLFFDDQKSSSLAYYQISIIFVIWTLLGVFSLFVDPCSSTTANRLFVANSVFVEWLILSSFGALLIGDSESPVSAIILFVGWVLVILITAKVIQYLVQRDITNQSFPGGSTSRFSFEENDPSRGDTDQSLDIPVSDYKSDDSIDNTQEMSSLSVGLID